MEKSLSYIHPNAQISDNVVVEPFSTIQEDVIIGEGTWIGPNVTIMNGARIGKNCKIYPGAVIAGEPQDLKFEGEHTTAEIGDNTTIRECVTVNRGTKDRHKTVIGKNCLIQAYSHIAHDCLVGDNCIFSNSSTLAGHITVGDYVVLAGMVAIHQFCEIGSHAFVTGGSLVRKDVPPYIKVAREPLSYAGINSVGLRRRGFSPDQIAEIQNIYRVLFVRHSNLAKALSLLEAEFKATEIRDEIIMFIRNSNRGVIKGFSQSKISG